MLNNYLTTNACYILLDLNIKSEMQNEKNEQMKKKKVAEGDSSFNTNFKSNHTSKLKWFWASKYSLRQQNQKKTPSWIYIINKNNFEHRQKKRNTKGTN